MTVYDNTIYQDLASLPLDMETIANPFTPQIIRVPARKGLHRKEGEKIRLYGANNYAARKRVIMSSAIRLFHRHLFGAKLHLNHRRE